MVFKIILDLSWANKFGFAQGKQKFAFNPKNILILNLKYIIIINIDKRFGEKRYDFEQCFLYKINKNPKTKLFPDDKTQIPGNEFTEFPDNEED